MNWLDFICLWVGYAVCVLALVRSVIESVFATYRAFRRMVRWLEVSRFFGGVHKVL